MPANAIALGFGHPANAPHGGTKLDVHLHLDHPEGPLSLGESWGSASGVGAQFTLQEAVDREEAHLRACGCEWLVLLAIEEKLRGKKLTPQEILAHMPATRTPAPLAEPKSHTRRNQTSRTAEVLAKIRAAISTGDFEALEGLRDFLNEAIVRELAQEWHPDLPWSIKDAYAALLMDQTTACVQPVFRDALKSPTVETRAYALCVLTGDFSRFSELLTQGGVDAAKVAAAIAHENLM